MSFPLIAPLWTFLFFNLEGRLWPLKMLSHPGCDNNILRISVTFHSMTSVVSLVVLMDVRGNLSRKAFSEKARDKAGYCFTSSSWNKAGREFLRRLWARGLPVIVTWHAHISSPGYLQFCVCVSLTGAHCHLECLSREGQTHRADSQHSAWHQLQSCARGYVLLPLHNHPWKGCQRGQGQLFRYSYFKYFKEITQSRYTWGIEQIQLYKKKH